MDARHYPGQGLSLQQLVFALNKELKRVAYSSAFTLNTVSQLDRDTTTALVTIREWRNTFVPINRIPLDVLSLIPTHLPSHGDRFRATFVCRHWRRTFIQYSALWSQLYLTNGEDYTKTLLERAKRSLLDVSIAQDVPINTMMLLFLHAQQITRLEFEGSHYWEVMRKFAEANTGPLPFLRTLAVSAYGTDGSNWQPFIVTPPPNPLFADAVNVEEFTFNSITFQFLNHFVFPNLTTFNLSTGKVDRSRALDLFDFLRASPLLRTVEIHTINGITLEDIPQDMVVILPNVETFGLISNGKNVYEIAVHISCPRARDVSLTCEMSDPDVSADSWEIFPTPVLWNTIVHQYTRSQVEEVVLEVQPFYDPCALTFRSSDASIMRLDFELLPIRDKREEFEVDFEGIVSEVFTQGFNTIRAHPLLSSIKRLRIRSLDLDLNGFQMLLTATEVGRLFESVGPLDELTIGGCELYPCLVAFGELGDLWMPVTFHPIKALTILHPMIERNHEEQCMNAVVGLAKSRHVRGIPFERVTFRAKRLPATMAERLMQWVGVVDCREEYPPAEDR